MKKINIFLSSAMTGELDTERNMIRFFFTKDTSLNEFYELFAIEDHASPREIEKAYIEEVQESNVVLFLFNRQLRKAVEKEYDTAKANNKRMLFYLKSSSRSKELKNFINREIFKYDPGSFSDAQRLCDKIKNDLRDDLIRTYYRSIKTIVKNDNLEITKISSTSPNSIYRFFPIDELRNLSNQSDICDLTADQLIVLSSIIVEESGNYKSALALLEIGLLQQSDNWILHNNRGLLLESMGLSEAAIFSYKKSIELNPSSDSAYYNLGNVYFNMSNFEKAAECFNKSLDIESDKGNAINQLAAVYIKLENPKLALKWAVKAFDINKDNISLINLISANVLNSNYDTALNLTEKIKKSEIQYLTILSFVKYKSGNYKEAIDYVDQLLKKGALEYDSASTKYYCLIELGKEKESNDWFQLIEKNYPLTPWQYNNLGYALVKKYNKSEYATEFFRKAVKQDPNLMVAWNNLQYNFNELGEKELGLRACEEALEINPFDPKSIKNKTLFLAESGNFSELMKFNINKSFGILGNEVDENEIDKIIEEAYLQSGIDKEKFDKMFKLLHELNKINQ